MNSISELNYIKNNNKYIEVGASTPLIELEFILKNIIQILQKFLNAMDHRRYVMLQLWLVTLLQRLQ
jgi:hypothetical protein